MRKLKILLPFNFIVLLFCLLTILKVVNTFAKPLYQEEKLGNQIIKGTVKNINITDYSTKIEVEDMLITTTGNFKLGEKVVCKGEVTIPSSKRNFYLFDYQKYLASKQIYYTMKGECEVEDTSTSLFYSIKSKIIERIEKMESFPYLKAFLLGDNKDISENVKESYQRNGISHLFSVSGMHITFFFLIFRFFIKSEKIRNSFLFIFLLFYLFLTNFSPSVIRASLFFFFSKMTNKLGFTMMQSYLLFTMLVLWYQPYFLYHTGFLYSFTISFFLLLFSKSLGQEKNYLKNLLKVSVISLMASIPIQIETNFSFNILSPFYNLFFVPIISNFLFPVSFLVFLFPFLDAFYFFLFSILESVSLQLVKIPSILILCHIPWVGVILYYVIFSFVMHKIIKKEYKYIVIFFIVIMFHFFLPYMNPKGTVLMMDVGQGDSTLVIYPHHTLTILVDTGGTFYESGIAKNTIIPTLHAHGITSLDYLVLSHGDLDHLGEAFQFLKSFSVKEVLFNSGNDNLKELEIMDYLKEKKIPYQKISKKSIFKKKETISFLNSKKEQDENEDSLVMFLTVNGHTILFMGDSGMESEKQILMEYELPFVDILKVGHHGSKYSSSFEFLSKINPTYCLISAGIDNRYGHPHQETLNRLNLCDTYITSIEGAIKITIGKSMRVTTVR